MTLARAASVLKLRARENGRGNFTLSGILNRQFAGGDRRVKFSEHLCQTKTQSCGFVFAALILHRHIDIQQNKKRRGTQERPAHAE